MAWVNLDILGIILSYSHPLDVGNLQFLSIQNKLVIQKHHYWRRHVSLKVGSKRRRLTDYIRYKRLVDQKRICYNCFSRKIDSRSRRVTHCNDCSYRKVLERIYHRSLFQGKRFFSEHFDYSNRN